MTAKRTRPNGENSIYPYRNGFAAYVWITTPSGRRMRKYVYGRTREDVHRDWIALQGKARRGPVATNVPTLAQYLHRWLEEAVEPNLAPLTASTYETLVRLYLEPGLGHVRLDRLKVRDVQAWFNQLQTECQCCAQGKDVRRAQRDPARARCCAKGACCRSYASGRTIKDARTVLRSALSHAMTEELVERNVAALVKAPKLRPRKVKSWTSDEARRFLESSRQDKDTLYAAFVLVLVLGLRKGEALGLTWESVDMTHGEVVIDHQLQRVKRQLLHRRTKSEASEATLPIPDLVQTSLQVRKAQQDQDRVDVGPAWRGLDEGPHFVFTGRYGTPIDPRTMNSRFTARCAAAGVRRLTVHDSRRTCATLLVDLDVHPRVIMRILRHADLAVTMEIYANASSKATQDALRRLGESLK